MKTLTSPCPLTWYELFSLHLAMEGCSNEEIGEIRGVAKVTVEQDFHEIYEKLGLLGLPTSAKRQRAINIAVERGWIRYPEMTK